MERCPVIRFTAREPARPMGPGRVFVPGVQRGPDLAKIRLFSRGNLARVPSLPGLRDGAQSFSSFCRLRRYRGRSRSPKLDGQLV